MCGCKRWYIHYISKVSLFSDASLTSETPVFTGPQGHVETSAADTTCLGAPGEANFSVGFLGLKPGPSLVVQLIEVGILRNSFTEQNGDSVKGRVITQELDQMFVGRFWDTFFDPGVLEGKGNTNLGLYRTKF